VNAVAVVQFPGSNCEAETARALASVGLRPWIHRWNAPARQLREAAAVVLPGGFSFQDRVRAGALAARLELMAVLVEMAAEGRPLLGICNGAQILVEAGLLPGWVPERVDLALARNRMRGRNGYYSRWVYLVATESAERCLFTRWLKPGTVLPIPVAHAEGRFVTRREEILSQLADWIPLRYADPSGQPTMAWPWNPNGSLLAAAGVTNPSGNVLGMMPHPERALWLQQVPPGIAGPWGRLRRSGGVWGKPGPGWILFRNLALHLRQQGGR
jgi:phosphoribosylformylglycinamidine synthase